MESCAKHPEDPAPITALVLCGGSGTRMGGVDKGLIELAGQPLVAHVIQRLAPQVGERVIVNCNHNLDAYRALGYPCVADLPGHRGCGPLAGIAAGLEQTSTRYCLICPCDTPLIPYDLVGKLLTPLQDGNLDIAVVHDGVRLQPLHGLMKTSLREDLLAFLESGGHAVHAWLETIRTVPVDFSEQAAAFRNLNTRKDLSDCATHWKDTGTCMQ